MGKGTPPRLALLAPGSRWATKRWPAPRFAELADRLGVDTIDLYQIHRLDPQTPMEEMLAALDHLVAQGKVRYIGASSMYAWQFQRLLSISERNGWARFVSMQNHYNLVYREEEREMMPLCLDQGLGVIPWSPLARDVRRESPCRVAAA